MSELFSPISVLEKMSIQKALKNVEESKGYLRNDFSQIAGILSRYNPLEVMKMALWEDRRIVSIGTKDPLKLRSASIMPLVLQSVLQSKLVSTVGNDLEIKQKDWNRLKDLSEDVTRRMVRLIDSFVAAAIGEGKVETQDAEGMRSSIAARLLPSGTDSLSVDRNVWMLRSMLKEIPDFQMRTGCDSASFALNVQNIARMGLNGIDMLVRDVAVYREEYSLAEAQLRASGELDGLDEADTFNLITKKNHWEGRAKELSSRRDGYSLFMPETASSLTPECYLSYCVKWGSLDLESFLDKGFWPSERYPFVEVGGKQYIFVAKYLPFFISISSGVDRFLSSSRDVLSIFHLADCDTYVYDGNKVEISVLPGVLDVNPFLYPSSFSKNVRKRKEEMDVKRKLGHKKMVVDPDMKEDMENKDDVLFVSSSFLFRATVDKNAKRDLLSRLLGNLELPEKEVQFLSDAEDDMYSSDSSQDDLLNETTTDEYEYSDEDEDEIAKEIEEKYDSISFVEYEKKEPTEEEKQSLIDRYSLTDDIIRKSEEEEKIEHKIEDVLDDDIFDDTEEEERLDEIGSGESSEDSEFFEAAESSDEYQEEEKDEADDSYGQLDFLSILDEEEPEEVEFDEELDDEDEESFLEEEAREELLDSESVLPGDKEIPEEEELSMSDDDSSQDDVILSRDEDSVSVERSSEVEEEIHVDEEDPESNEETADTEPQTSLETEETSDAEDEEEESEEKALSSEEDTSSPWGEKIDDNTFVMNDDNSSLPTSPLGEKEEEKAPLDFIGSLFASVGYTDEEEDEDTIVPEESVSEEPSALKEDEPETEEALEETMEDPVAPEEETEEAEETEDIEEPEEVEETIGEEVEEDDPGVKAKGVVLSIYNKLGKDSSFASFISSSDQATLDQLDSVIRSCWNRQIAEGKDKLFNISDFSLSILLAHDSIRDELRLSELLNNAGGVMYSRGEEEWKAVIVYINSDFVVEEAIEKTISRSSFSSADWKRVTYIGEQMRRR